MKIQMMVTMLATVLCGALFVQAADDSAHPKTELVERAVAALRAEQKKFAAGKSMLFTVCQAAKDLRSAELQASANTEQRIAALKRHVELLRQLKQETDTRIQKGLLAPLDGKLVAQQLKEAEEELSPLQASANTEQRIAALKGHVESLRQLKQETDTRIQKGLLAPLDGKLAAQELKKAEEELSRAQDRK